MLVPWLTSLDGTLRRPLFSIGPYGSWGDLTYRTRWGQGASGMYEASLTMALPPEFDHPLLKRGVKVDLMHKSRRRGSSLIMASPTVGADFSEPWTITCTGLGREVEGENSFYASDSGGDTTSVPSTAVDQAKLDGWGVAGRLSSVPTSATGGSSVSDELMSVGSLLTAAADPLGQRWGVDSDNYVFFAADPTTPTYHVIPGAAALGTTDDDYASTVKFRYHDSSVDSYETATATNAPAAATFGPKQYGTNQIALGPITAAVAQGYADAILAKVKGRLNWTNSLTLTSDQILTAGGGPANLSRLAENVGRGCMIRLHGIWNDLLAYNGQKYLDIVIGEAVLVDGAQSINLSPAGLSPRDFAAVVESVTGMAASAA